MLSIEEKKAKNPYKVTSSGKVADMDIQKNIVTGLFNSYFFIDSDKDMILPGAAKKSIKERGPQTQAGNKIKHLKDHNWSKVIARIDKLEEKTVSYKGRQVAGIYHESYYDPKIEESRDMLAKIEAGYYDDRSIGFQYKDLSLAERDSEEELYRENWRKFYPFALNPEKADEDGYFFVVREIKLFEGSDVGIGANSLTPFLGTKDGKEGTPYERMIEKIRIIEKLLHNGNITDQGGQELEIEVLQLKQSLFEMESKPDIKATLINSRKSTIEKPNEAVEFYKNLLKHDF